MKLRTVKKMQTFISREEKCGSTRGRTGARREVQGARGRTGTRGDVRCGRRSRVAFGDVRGTRGSTGYKRNRVSTGHKGKYGARGDAEGSREGSS